MTINGYADPALRSLHLTPENEEDEDTQTVDQILFGDPDEDEDDEWEDEDEDDEWEDEDEDDEDDAFTSARW